MPYQIHPEDRAAVVIDVARSLGCPSATSTVAPTRPDRRLSFRHTAPVRRSAVLPRPVRAQLAPFTRLWGSGGQPGRGHQACGWVSTVRGPAAA